MVEKGKSKANKKIRVSKFRKQRAAKLPPAVEVKIHRGEDSMKKEKHSTQEILTSSQNDSKRSKKGNNFKSKASSTKSKNEASKSKK